MTSANTPSTGSNQYPRIPFALPSISEREIEAVVETLRSGWLTTGPKTKAFEEAFAQAVGARHALGVNSGTAALHLALEALGIEAEDRVLVPTWTFTATAEVVRYLGAHPVFVDADPATLNIDVAKLEERIVELKREHGDKVKAVMPVHIGGQACEMDKIVALAGQHRLAIVEDAAHAFPTTAESASVTAGERKSRMVGSIGHATAFSFYATKTIATGEGGMLTTDDDRMAERVRLMRLHGVSKDASIEAPRRCRLGTTKSLRRASNTISPMSRQRLAWCNCKEARSCWTGGWRSPGDTVPRSPDRWGLNRPRCAIRTMSARGIFTSYGSISTSLASTAISLPASLTRSVSAARCISFRCTFSPIGGIATG